MKSNIALIGFMGTGKTSVGTLLAKKLGKSFVETDSIIERKTGRKITEIFRRDGEIRFRELEIEAVKEAAEKKNAVISCGGGAVMNQINVQRLRENSSIVLLAASPETILERTGKSGDRPLLEGKDKLGKIKQLLESRKNLYSVSDYTLDTSGMSAEKAAEKIIVMLNDSKNREK